MNKPSKFAALEKMQALRAVQLEEATPPQAPPAGVQGGGSAEPPPRVESSPPPPRPTSTVKPPEEDLGAEAPGPRALGRPPGGKRGNPQYRSIMAYIPLEQDRALRIAMAQGDHRELSEVLEQAIALWLEHHALR